MLNPSRSYLWMTCHIRHEVAPPYLGGAGGIRGGGVRRPRPAHLGQGARKATCTLRRCRHARTSSRAASHACAVTSSPRGGTRAVGAAGATPGRATPHHTTGRIPSGLRPAPRRLPHTGPGAWRGARRPVRGTGQCRVGDTRPMASGALLLAVPPLDHKRPALRGIGLGLRGGGPGVVGGEGT